MGKLVHAHPEAYLWRDPFAAPTRRAKPEELKGNEVLDMQLAVEILHLPSVDGIFNDRSCEENLVDFIPDFKRSITSCSEYARALQTDVRHHHAFRAESVRRKGVDFDVILIGAISVSFVASKYIFDCARLAPKFRALKGKTTNLDVC